MSNIRYPYSLKEDSAILQYIIKGKYESLVGGNTMWKKLEKTNTCPGRTWQSLKNRFLKNIRPDLARPEFGLTQQQKASLMAGANRRAHSSFCSEQSSDIFNLDISSDSLNEEDPQMEVVPNNNNDNVSESGDHEAAAPEKDFQEKEFLTWNAEWSDSDATE